MAEILSRAPLTVLLRELLNAEETVALLAVATRSVPGGSEARRGAPGAKHRGALEDPWDEAERAAIAVLNRRMEAVVGTKLCRWSVHYTAPDVEEHAVGVRGLPLGLHVDTLHAPRRFMTALLYLTTVPAGGGTAFPLAAPMDSGKQAPWLHVLEERAVRSSQRLLDLGIEHTQQVSRVFERGDAAAVAVDLLEAYSANPSCGLSVQPIAGNVVLFFTRGIDAQVDARAWHGGVVVTEGAKWTLQNFIELPDDVPLGEESTYITARREQVFQYAMG